MLAAGATTRRRWSTRSTCCSRPASCRTATLDQSSKRRARRDRRRPPTAAQAQPCLRRASLLIAGLARIPGAEMRRRACIDIDDRSTRRAFLQRAARLSASVGGASAAARSTSPPSARRRAVDRSDYKALVCVFLYGGNDYANTVVPYDDSRATTLYSAPRGGTHRASPRDARWPPTALNPCGGAAPTTGSTRWRRSSRRSMPSCSTPAGWRCCSTSAR